MAVPEGAVYEDGDPVQAEDEVRFAGEILRVDPPAPDADSVKGLS